MWRPGEERRLFALEKTEHGMYLSEKNDPGQKVLLPAKEVPCDLKKGDEIAVFLYRDSSDRLTATVRTPKIKLGEVALLGVSALTKIGAFVDWGLEKELLLPFAEQTKKVHPGEEVLVALYLDKSGRLALTMNVYEYLKTDAPYRKDDRVTGRVYLISERFGAFVAVDDLYSALIPRKELFSDIRVGQQVEARVTEVKEDGKLTLAVREKAYLQMDPDAEKVLAVIDSFDGKLPFNDHADPEVIKREFGLSKNAFKRAVGKLYKERKILITEDSIIRTDQGE
ncbi:MAG: S1 RNA-binding domain-containing protein [Lachnospiraceae bacterium]|nr:S1 RNA-binding domain-containing protein [Lachnospiraceae bacterium]